MATRAMWRSRVDDPKSPLGWVVRDLACAPRLLVSRFAWGMRLFALVVALRGEWGEALVVVGFSVFPPALFEFLAWIGRSRLLPGTFRLGPKPLPVGDLLTVPPPARPYPCHIESARRGTLLGFDAAIVTFVDGWLHVEGRRASFALRRADVSRYDDERLFLHEGGTIRFEVQDRLTIGDHEARDLTRLFKADLKSWARSDSPAGEPILPPASVHATGVARAWIRFWAGLVFGGLCVAPLWGTRFAWALAASFGWSLLCALGDLARLRRVGRPLPARPVVE